MRLVLVAVLVAVVVMPMLLAVLVHQDKETLGGLLGMVVVLLLLLAVVAVHLLWVEMERVVMLLAMAVRELRHQLLALL